MRADVKLGVVISVVLVSIAGGYYAFRADREKPILVDQAAPGSAKRPAKATPHPAADNRSAERGATPNGRALRGGGTSHDAGKPRAGMPDKSQPLATRQGVPPSDSTAATRQPAAADTRLADGAAKPGLDGRGATVPSAVNPSLAGPGAAKGPGSTVPATHPQPALTDNARPASDVPSDGATSPSAAQPRSALLAAPIAKPTSQPAQDTAGSSDSAVDRHRVQVGDTMASLAERYYGAPGLVGFLTASNPQLADPTRLQLGQVVLIPPRPTSAAAPPKTATPPVARAVTTTAVKSYRVREGDSFYKIAGTQLGNSARWQEIYELNKPLVGDDPGRLKVGQLLVLPGQ